MDLQYEITRQPPPGWPTRDFGGRTPILYAFECALFETEEGRGFVYSATNMKSGNTERIGRLSTPLTQSNVEKMADRLRQSKVAGRGRFEVEREPNEEIDVKNAHEILLHISKNILPGYGLRISKEEISLAKHILTAINQRNVSLTQADTESVIAYLLPVVLIKRGRMGEFANMALYPGMQYAEMLNMPIVISVSSPAIQKAIRSAIPDLSRMLLEHGIIKTPLSEKSDIMVCNHQYLLTDTIRRANGQNALIPNYQAFFIADAHGFLRAAVQMYCVKLPEKAAANIQNAVDGLTFQREAHRKPIRQTAKKLCVENTKLFKGFSGEMTPAARRHLQNIHDLTERLVLMLRERLLIDKVQDILLWVAQKYSVDTSGIQLQKVLTPDKLHQAICNLPELKRKAALEVAQRNKRHYSTAPERQAIRNEQSSLSGVIWRKVRNLLPVERGCGDDEVVYLLWDLEKIREQTAEILRQDDLICWLEKTVTGNHLCAKPKDLERRLFKDQWSRGIPTVIFSDTAPYPNLGQGAVFQDKGYSLEGDNA